MNDILLPAEDSTVAVAKEELDRLRCIERVYNDVMQLLWAYFCSTYDEEWDDVSSLRDNLETIVSNWAFPSYG